MRRRPYTEAAGPEEDNDTIGVDRHPSATSPARGASSHCTRPTTPVVRFRRRFYTLHSSIVLFAVILGMMHNGGNRKYIAVNPRGLLTSLSDASSTSVASYGSIDATTEGSCHVAFVNVHSFAIDEDHAAICCSVSGNADDYDGESWYHSNLCHPRLPFTGVPVRRLPFAGRLTHLLEAWVLPLLPIFIHLTYQLVFPGRTEVDHSSASAAATSQSSANRLVRTTLRRLLFYVLLLNIRGFGLYIGANTLEEYALQTWLTMTNSMSDAAYHLHNSGDRNSCWYEVFLKAHQKSTMRNDKHSQCYGRQFDFSDHVVLFLANYLVIFVAEILVIYSIPFWHSKTTNEIRINQRKSIHFCSNGSMWKILLAALFVYLHILVCHALYQTAAYFHTPAEILVGYAVSMIIQLPVIYLMCSDGPHWVKASIGLQSEKNG
ncbi:hypothetical protein ACHAXA_007685 [Cyclostephanos tholiformis]|uniref:Uncharacterized protein n=1 Tax=Cyclostephanos tholiformis TaxID=382380 RepID=A0ABD3SDG2_9STRA